MRACRGKPRRRWPTSPPPSASERDGGLTSTVEVLPDVTGIDRVFHYSVEAPVEVGTLVRVLLHGRRVRGWVVARDTPVPPGVEPRPIVEVVSAGPPAEVVELCRWASWRWAGRLRPLLLAASPERIVRSVPARAAGAAPLESEAIDEDVRAAISAADAVLRLPPGVPRQPVVEAALRSIDRANLDALVLVESRGDAERLSTGLRRAGWPVAVYPEEWGAAAAGGRVVIGTRNASLAPLPSLSLLLVLDAHSESYRSERVPTFDARLVAAERARRSGAPVVFVTACPSVELLEGRGLVTVSRSRERNGWGTVAVIDSRAEDPTEGAYPSRLVGWMRDAVESGSRPVVCVLNRRGRARLLTCHVCRSVQRCPRCGTAQVQLEKPAKGEVGVLTCPRCEGEQPAICPACGSTRMRVLRPGVGRAREQLEALLGVEVGEVSGPRAPIPATPVVVGTEAVLHRVGAAEMVVFLDFDQELLAPRLRAGEHALGLVARAVRLVGGSVSGSRRVVLQTSVPGHEVVKAAQLGDPGVFADAERARRRALELPPYRSLARIEGPGAGDAVARLPGEVQGAQVADGEYLVMAASAEELADALAVLAPGGTGGWAALDARVEVDPIDV